ncbi:hypothetical protein IWQ62_006392, partial [Dispira parvispora]
LLSYGDDQPLDAPDSLNDGLDEVPSDNVTFHQPADAMSASEEDATTKRDSKVAGLDDECSLSDSSTKKTKYEPETTVEGGM